MWTYIFLRSAFHNITKEKVFYHTIQLSSLDIKNHSFHITWYVNTKFTFLLHYTRTVWKVSSVYINLVCRLWSIETQFKIWLKYLRLINNIGLLVKLSSIYLWFTEFMTLSHQVEAQKIYTIQDYIVYYTIWDTQNFN